MRNNTVVSEMRCAGKLYSPCKLLRLNFSANVINKTRKITTHTQSVPTKQTNKVHFTKSTQMLQVLKNSLKSIVWPNLVNSIDQV